MNKKVQKIEPEEGYKGFLAIRCEKCGMLNAYCGRRKSDHYRCRCGAITPLHDLVRVYVYCECRRSAVYRTNVTDPVFVYENNFPKSNFNNVAHVRNKAGESEYFCENANSVRLKKTAEIITLKEIPEELKNTLIPTGEYMTKQCFWFNKKYLKQQIKDFIKSY